MKQSIELPAWFNTNDYSVCKNFSIVEWYFNIHLRAQFLLPLYSLSLSKKENRLKFKEHAANDIRDNWDSFIKQREALLTVDGIAQSVNQDRDKMIARSYESVRPITVNELRAFSHKEIQHAESNTILCDLLLINVNLSEEQLLKTFSAYIKEFKQKMLFTNEKICSKKKYLRVIESEFTVQDFHRWCSNAILPYMDLMMWEAHADIGKIKDVTVSNVLNIEQDKLRGDTRPLIKRILTLDYLNILYTKACQSI